MEAGENQAQVGQDAVQLMTVHASKGLEFDIVFITGLEEDMFPHFRSKNDKKALQEESQDLATSVFAKDNLLDEINAEATTILAGYIAKHPDSVLPCLNLVSVFRKLERSGDHITNIAEEIVFFIDAKVLKHSGKTDEHYPLSKK